REKGKRRAVGHVIRQHGKNAGTENVPNLTDQTPDPEEAPTRGARRQVGTEHLHAAASDALRHGNPEKRYHKRAQTPVPISAEGQIGKASANQNEPGNHRNLSSEAIHQISRGERNWDADDSGSRGEDT